MNHANGDQYKGSWLNDQRHGSGTCQVVRLQLRSRTSRALLCCKVSVLTVFERAVCQLGHFCGQFFRYSTLVLFHCTVTPRTILLPTKTLCLHFTSPSVCPALTALHVIYCT